MNPESVDTLLVHSGATLKTALTCIDTSGLGICFVVDGGSGELLGVLTDGDARRALLAGAKLDDPVAAVMRRDCVSLPVDAGADVIQQQVSEVMRAVPLVDASRRVVDFASVRRIRRLPVMEPALDGNELAYVTDCIRTNWISSQGQYVRRFEELFASLLEMPVALACTNGTAALHLALAALDVGPGDEVIVPDLTFAAAANAALYVGATPVLVDVDPATWTLDSARVAEAITDRTRAVVAVHLYGHPCDMDGLLRVTAARGVQLVEDCAESLGSRYGQRLTGTFGAASAFSFFGNKTVTTGEGGIVAFRSSAAGARAARLRDHGMSPDRRYWHDVVGHNYRMTNLQAAIGVAQMERLDQILERKRDVAALYAEQISKRLPDVRLAPDEAWATTVHWLYTVLLPAESIRDTVAAQLLSAGIETRPTFVPLHEMPLYHSYARGRSFPFSSSIGAKGLSLPSSPTLSNEQVRFIVDALYEAVWSAASVAEGGRLSR